MDIIGTEKTANVDTQVGLLRNMVQRRTMTYFMFESSFLQVISNDLAETQKRYNFIQKQYLRKQVGTWTRLSKSNKV